MSDAFPADVTPMGVRLEPVYRDLTLLSNLAVQAVQDSVQSLLLSDSDKARRVGVNDAYLNHTRLRIEDMCYRYRASGNDADLYASARRLAGIVNVATNLERIGDHAAQIAMLSVRLPRRMLLIDPLPSSFSQMAEITQAMISNAVEAFVHDDDLLAERMVRRDREVDEFHEQMYRDLSKWSSGNPALIETTTLLLWVSHNLERIGDHAANICERAIFVATGELKEFH